MAWVRKREIPGKEPGSSNSSSAITPPEEASTRLYTGNAGRTGSTTCRVVVTSVGEATPAASAAVAKGLGLPTDQIVACCYRAPAVLVDEIDRDRAEQIAELLASIGFEIDIQPDDAAPPGPQFCYDVALYLREPARLQDCADVLADFIGTGTDEALGLLMRPPGVVLGNVSRATVDAFARRLPEGTELLWSRPEEARYVCLVLPGSPLLQRSVWDDLSRHGYDVQGQEGIVAADVDHATARALWQRHHAGGVLQVVNQDFLRFDVRLIEPAQANPDSDTVTAALANHTDIPAELYAAVLSEAPITLVEALPNTDLSACLEALHGADLKVAAECITFQACQLALTRAPGSVEQPILTQLSLSAARHPDPSGYYRLDPPLNDLQARSLHAVLADHGIDTVYCEVGQ